MKVVRELVPAVLALATLALGFYWLTNIPALKPYHPPAIACDVVAILSLPFSFWIIGESRLDNWGAVPAITALMAWIGFGWVLTDKPCLAAFCGNLGVALVCNIPATVFFGGHLFIARETERKFNHFQARVGIFLIAAACILGPLTH